MYEINPMTFEPLLSGIPAVQLRVSMQACAHLATLPSAIIYELVKLHVLVERATDRGRVRLYDGR